MKACGVITLLSDFGLQDPYVAEMKGVLLNLNPKAELVDISHLIPSGEIPIGAFRLWRAYRHFPKGTVHLAVVDPGVGTSRALLLAVSEDYFFLAPDNGLLSLALEETDARCYALEPRPWNRTGGATFHGRDLLAPAAAALSVGKEPKRLGRPVGHTQSLPFWATPRQKRLEGRVIDVDRFGNLITNIRESLLRRKGKFEIQYRNRRFLSLNKTYGNKKGSAPIALIGSCALLEIALPHGNAQKALRGCVGQKVTVRYA